MRIDKAERKECELDYLVGKIVTVMVGSTAREMSNPEEFHNMFTGFMVQQNHLGIWLKTSLGRTAFVFWHAIQGVFVEHAMDPDSDEGRNLKEKIEKAEKAEKSVKPPVGPRPIQVPHHPPACGMLPGTPPETIQLTFDRLKEKAATAARQRKSDGKADS